MSFNAYNRTSVDGSSSNLIRVGIILHFMAVSFPRVVMVILKFERQKLNRQYSNIICISMIMLIKETLKNFISKNVFEISFFRGIKETLVFHGSMIKTTRTLRAIVSDFIIKLQHFSWLFHHHCLTLIVNSIIPSLTATKKFRPINFHTSLK